MSKIIMLRGLPASGKTTKCKELVAQGNWARLNRDLLREMLHFNKWSGKKEGITIGVQVHIAKLLLKKKISVVIDDCNLGGLHKARWSNIAAECDAKFEVIEMDTSIKECRTRDLTRPNPVGADVICNMANQYGLHKQELDIILVDLDGTLCDITHRLHFVKDVEKKDWKSFFEAMVDDVPRQEIMDLCHQFIKEGKEVIYCSGRPDNYRDLTEDWLAKHKAPHCRLIMRQANDKRPDTLTKQDMLDKYIDKSKVVLVIDDRPSIIRMWESNGLKVKDVGKGVEF